MLFRQYNFIFVGGVIRIVSPHTEHFPTSNPVGSLLYCWIQASDGDPDYQDMVMESTNEEVAAVPEKASNTYRIAAHGTFSGAFSLGICLSINIIMCFFRHDFFYRILANGTIILFFSFFRTCRFRIQCHFSRMITFYCDFFLRSDRVPGFWRKESRN